MIYDSATFFFYSGTGNSLRVAMWMADIVREAGVPATVSASGGAAPEWEVGRRPGEGGQSVVGLRLPMARWLAEAVPSLAAVDAVPGWAADLVVWSALMLLGYPLWDLLLRAPWFRRLAGLATVTRWYRRYHEAETRATDLPGSDPPERS